MTGDPPPPPARPHSPALGDAAPDIAPVERDLRRLATRLSPADDVVRALEARLREQARAQLAPRPGAPGRVGLAIALLAAEVPLVRQQLWAASAVVLGLGCAVGLTAGHRAGALLTLLAPLVAAAGVATVYGPEADPLLEVALATPTSPRLILLARLTLVCGYDCLWALAGSLLLVRLGTVRDGLVALSLRWLGPLLFLSAFSLALSLRLGTLAGVGIALAVWAGIVLLGAAGPPAPLAAVGLLRSTNLVTLGLAGALGWLALARLPSQERFA